MMDGSGAVGKDGFMMLSVLKWLLVTGVTMSSVWAQPRGQDEGLTIMASRTAGNCVTCHDIPAWRDQADTSRRLTLQGTFGPSLQGVGQRYSREQLRQWVVDARVMQPQTLMPPYGTVQGLNAPARQQPLLSAAQIDAVVEALTRFTTVDGQGTTASAVSAPSATSSVEQLQLAQDMNPVVLWVERGRQTWTRDCSSCHDLTDVVAAVPHYPKLDAQHNLVNLEDRIQRCRRRTETGSTFSVEDTITLGLSAFLHESARDRPILVAAPREAAAATRWQQHLDAGEQLYSTRMGHMNLSCRQCHDDKVGSAMRAQRINSAHPVGFPVYRISWQGMGSMDRRIRACFSGVQAQVPAPQDVRLRQLELFMKYRAQGQRLQGPLLKP